MSEYDALLEPPPKSEYDALLSEPEPPARVEEIKAAPTIMGELSEGRIGSAAGLAKNRIEEALSSTQPATALQVHGEGGRSLLGTTERIPPSPDDSALTSAGKAIVNVGNQTMAGLTAPETIGLLPIGAAEVTTGKILGGLFGAQAATAIPGQVKEAFTAPTTQGKVEGGLGAVLSALFAGAGAAHATGLTAKLFPEKAKTAPAEVPLPAPIEPVEAQLRAIAEKGPLPEPIATEPAIAEPVRGLEPPVAATEPVAAPVVETGVVEPVKAVETPAAEAPTPQGQAEVTGQAEPTEMVTKATVGTVPETRESVPNSGALGSTPSVTTISGEYEGGTKHSPLGDSIRRRINTVADAGANKSAIEHPQKGLWSVINADTRYAYQYAKEQAARLPDDAASYNKIVKAIEKELPKIKNEAAPVSEGAIQPAESVPQPKAESASEIPPQGQAEPGAQPEVAAVEPAPAAEGEPATTGIAQRVHDERAKTGKQGEILLGEGTTPEEMIQRGRDLLKAGADPESIITGVSEGKAVTGDEMATLRAKHEELSKATDAAADAVRKNPNDPAAKQAYEDSFKAETEFAQRIKPAATEWHKVGQSMQGTTDIETGSFNGLRRAFVERTGRDVTPKEAVKLEKTADNVKRVTEELEKAKAAYREVVGKETKGRAPKTVEDLRTRFAERIRKLTPCE